MQKWFLRKGFFIPIVSLMIFSVIAIFVIRVRNNEVKQGNAKQERSLITLTGYDEARAFYKYRSFQNADSTWGFTIFLNARPYLHYKNIPDNRKEKGFSSRKDAEKVADLFVKLIKNGDLNPQLDRKSLDSLKIILN
jgi:hypothetical protein